MKIELSQRPTTPVEPWPGAFQGFSWMEFTTAIPTPVFLVTTQKENGNTNACFEGWSAFHGEGDDFFILLSGMNTGGHTYANIQRTGEFCVNFLSSKHYEACAATIRCNGADNDELTDAGLTPEAAVTLTVPRIKEAFLSMECSFEWEKPLTATSHSTVLCGRVRHLSLSPDWLNSGEEGRVGPDGFMLFSSSPMHPDKTGLGRNMVGHVAVNRLMD